MGYKLKEAHLMRMETMWSAKDLETFIRMISRLSGIDDVTKTRHILLENAIRATHPIFLRYIPNKNRIIQDLEAELHISQKL